MSEPTISSLNNEIDIRISFDESDDEDYMVIFDKNSFSYSIIYVNDLKTDLENGNEIVNMPSFPSPEPTVSCFDDLDFFKDFKNEFPAIIYNDALTSKSDFLTEPTTSPQHIDEFNLKYETSLSKCDEEEQKDLVKEISTNIGGEFTNMEILKCWSLETSRRLVWKPVRYGVSNELDTAFDIFENIHILYLQYGVFTSSRYGVLSFNPLWSLVSAGTDMPYLP
ncbi:hypothetical protein Tco_0937534 [Tanacetum coccineum]|uniref:Uncharacterized protein n=1 Tax=Tanacetum coccineum TaxID=301880 RepID=A0ABQ5DFA2_9ASTR